MINLPRLKLRGRFLGAGFALEDRSPILSIAYPQISASH